MFFLSWRFLLLSLSLWRYSSVDSTPGLFRWLFPVVLVRVLWLREVWRMRTKTKGQGTKNWEKGRRVKLDSWRQPPPQSKQIQVGRDPPEKQGQNWWNNTDAITHSGGQEGTGAARCELEREAYSSSRTSQTLSGQYGNDLGKEGRRSMSIQKLEKKFNKKKFVRHLFPLKKSPLKISAQVAGDDDDCGDGGERPRRRTDGLETETTTK